MNRRIIFGMLALALGCGSSGNMSNGSGGSSATGGNGTGSGGNGSGSGGSTQGTGGKVGSGGSGAASGGTTGSGGTTTGTGGAAIGSGGTGTGGAGTATGGKAGATGAGTGGRGGATTGTGGAMTGSGGAGGASSGTGSVLERNNHPSRDGHFLQPQITVAAATAAAKTKDAAFAASFTGNMWASPLYLQNGPSSKGIFIAVTTSNTVIALDETDGHTVWMTSIGSSPTANQTGMPSCGTIHPLGIISTPVIDASARKVYVAGAIGTTSIMKHEIHALSVDDGTDAKSGGWPVDVTTVTDGSISFSSATSYYNQRSALSLVNGILYVPYGGHVGDCGGYHGWVVAVNASDATKVAGWATKGSKGEAIWAAGGMASDGTSVFPVTGNNTAGTSTHADSEEVVRISGMAVADTSSSKNVYYPTSWSTMDSLDYDLGSVNSVYIEMPNATPSKYIVTISKDGHLYLLDSTNLGGMGGALKDFAVASAGMSIHTVPAVYSNTAGAHVVFSTDAGAKCPSGGATGRVVMSVLLPAAMPTNPSVEWCAPLGMPVTAPIVTTTDGSSNPIVWYMSAGKLLGVDGSSGANIYTSTDTCSNIQEWTSPIAVNGRIVTGGNAHLCSWTVH